MSLGDISRITVYWTCQEFAKLKFFQKIISKSVLNIFTCMSTGYPVAWCLFDHGSSEVIKAFLRSIQTKLPLTGINVIITDVDMVKYCYKY